ncbi:MAG: hypothetical protein HYT43_01120 [Candidatus Taylorbacteria bacterium]|nr:hypothetical protein [Candidatus Taylorbacteria bacterium]
MRHNQVALFQKFEQINLLGGKAPLKRLALIITVGAVLLGSKALYNHLAFGNWKQLSNLLPEYNGRNLGFLELNSEREAKNKSNPFDGQSLSIFHLRHGLYTLTISPRYGIFALSPVFFLSILVVFALRKEMRREHLVMIIAIAANILLYASFKDPNGGWSFGSRYLVPSMPFLSILAVLAANLKNAGWRIGVFLTCLYSTANALSGALTTSSLSPWSDSYAYGIKNFKFVLDGISGSFFYNEVLKSGISLVSYWLILFIILAAILVYLIFGSKTQAPRNSF